MEIKKLKQKVFWDVDDVVLNSMETIIEIINEQYNKPNNLPQKSIKDIKDWTLRSINRDLTAKKVKVLFESDEFWNKVSIKPDFYNLLLEDFILNYDYIFITQGTLINLIKKFRFLLENNEVFGSMPFIGMLDNAPKSTVDMSGAIQIDDKIDNLIHTNASIKILLTNNLDTQYNNFYGKYAGQIPDNLYVANNLQEVKQILDFNLKHDLLSC